MNRHHTRLQRLFITAAIGWMLFINLPFSHATDRTWNGGNYGDWNIASNWLPYGVPANGDNVTLNLLGAVNMTVYYTNPNSAIGVLYINKNSPGYSMTLDQGYRGTYNLATAGEYIGWSGPGIYKHSLGTHTVQDYLIIGVEQNVSNGSAYHLSGTGVLSAAREYIGHYGNASFIQTGGSNTASGNLDVGYSASSTSTYNQSGGSLSANNEYIGNAGMGNFIQSGGTNTVAGTLTLGSSSTTAGGGTYYLNGTGSLSAVTQAIGQFGNGSFTHTGGTNTVTGNITLGVNPGITGTYDFNGGLLSARNIDVGYSGIGTFTHRFGTSNISENLTIATKSGSTGTYNLQGGTVNANSININQGGTFNYSGGAFTGSVNNSGTMNVSGIDSKTIPGLVTNSGNFNVTNTTVIYNSTFINRGAYHSDPSINYFSDLVVESTGYITGGSGDQFYIYGNLINNSTRYTDWNTANSLLGLIGAGAHQFYLAGADLGTNMAGYTNNFAWGTLAIENSLSLFDGNGQSGGAQYVQSILGAVISGNMILNIHSQPGLNIYYLATAAGNEYLHGLAYNLDGGGQLIPIGNPVPVPPAVWLLGSGLIGLAGLRRRWKK